MTSGPRRLQVFGMIYADTSPHKQCSAYPNPFVNHIGLIVFRTKEKEHNGIYDLGSTGYARQDVLS